MQKDMHYYGTYCLARAAGIKQDSASTIAYAAQFVDDNVASHVEDHEDGGKIIAVPTAHHVGDLKNRDEEDQRFIWVPFHFLPGNQGTAWTERLICRKNSKLAQAMIAHHRQQTHLPYILELMGIGAHVYLDTFAHWGFSGVSSRRNRVKGDSLILTQENAVVESALGRTFGEWINEYGGLLKNVRSKISGVAELYSGSLGHGGVSNYPDLPFLQWSFEYEQTGTRIHHDNPATFLEGAEATHEWFWRFAQSATEHQDSGTLCKWSEIKDHIAWIFSQEVHKDDRIEIWKVASLDGRFGVQEVIPNYDAKLWNEQADNLEHMGSSTDALDLEIHHFYRAANRHLHYVLRELLPENNLLIV